MLVSIFLTGIASNDKKECSYGGYLYATESCTVARRVVGTVGTGQRRSNFRTFGIRSGIFSPNMSACFQGRVSSWLF